MDIIQQIKLRSGQAASNPQQTTDTASYNPKMRLNYLTMANAVELSTEIIAAVIKGSNGVSGEVGGARLLKRDIADMAAARMAARLSEAAASEGDNQ
ncbi:hypothetical protein pEaSNUABM38_00216 [Erwinia phage pEa_SNUABM_38]|nr:hypothetical protein pEaSNUABM38_00216 [Erwinia phage pEa_SNUABM_38]